MGLIQRAYETYCAMEQKYAGCYIAEQKEPLAPISHLLTSADIEITLDVNGRFVNAAAVDKEEPKTIIPVTEKSAGRTSHLPMHPLSDKLCYFAAHEDVKQYAAELRQWAESPYGHPKLYPILHYIEGETILVDLTKCNLIELNEKGMPKKENLLIRWRVLDGDFNHPAECWKDRSLFQAFIQYYASTQEAARAFCMISGEQAPLAIQHPKGIIAIKGNAKLISSNDTSGFTYRGRFTDGWQPATVSYAVSQKAHNALRWLAANQGVYFGGRVFLCWNPEGIMLPQPSGPMLRKTAEKQIKPSDYRQELLNTLKGWRDQLPKDACAVIAAFDAATTGRLAVTYYNELQASDFLERLHAWDESCCWWNGQFGIQSPSFYQIVSCAFGTLRTQKDKTKIETDDRVMRQQVQRLLACRVDKRKMPWDILQALVQKATNLQIYDSGQREMLLSTACAVIKKYHYDKNQEECEMALEPDRQDISYQYGRLLAVLEKIERDTYDKEENREPNAMRMQPVFARRPQYATRIIWEQLKKAYYPRLKPGSRAFYDRLIGEIMGKISAFSNVEQKRPLGDTYLLGYYLQRSDLYQPKKESDSTEE